MLISNIIYIYLSIYLLKIAIVTLFNEKGFWGFGVALISLEVRLLTLLDGDLFLIPYERSQLFICELPRDVLRLNTGVH